MSKPAEYTQGNPFPAQLPETIARFPGVEAINWWHSIELAPGIWTNGLVQHGARGGDWPTTRFGMPKDLTGKTVLDVGCWDGFFSFEAERRGGRVTAIEYLHAGHPRLAGFEFAKRVLNSSVELIQGSVEWLRDNEDLGLWGYDVVMCYGVLYHIENPHRALRELLFITTEVLLIETAIHKGPECALFYKPGFDNDPTNKYYPTLSWIERAALKLEPTAKVEVVYTDGIRATVRITK